MWNVRFLCLTITAVLIGIFDAVLAEGIPHHVYHRIRIHNKALRKHRAVGRDGALHFDPEPFSSKKLELNSSGKIHCKVAGGTPPIVVEWFLNDSDPLPDGMTSSGGTLIVSEALQRHRGRYTCRAKDAHSTITFKVTVDIVVKPRILEPQNGARVHATEGTDVYLQCIVEGEPPPAVTWDRNITILTRQVGDVAMEGDDDEDIASTVVFQNGSLLLRNVSTENTDKYGCTAGSSAGLQRADLFLYVHKEGELYDDSTGIGSKAVVISISVAGAYMLLVIALMVYCRNRRHRNREDKLELEMAEGAEKLVEEGDATDEKQKLTGNGVRNGRTLHEKDSGADNSESAVSRGSKKSQYEYLSVPRNMLTDLIVLGRGEFGEVSLGNIDMVQVRRLRKRGRDPNKDAPAHVDVRPVLVKALTTKDETQLAEFRRQIELFSKVRHENIVRLIGLVNDSEPHCLLLESTDWGDLKRFLISTRTQSEHNAYIARVGAKHIEPAPTDSVSPLAATHCLALVGHLASAAAALPPNYTLRDIAARNCVITSKLQLKVTLPALTRGPYSHEYYKLHDRVIPLRWLPLEVVIEGDYSTKSDVYMFAATVWEIYSKAELPFAKLNDNSVLEKLRSGTLEWTVPSSVPDRLSVLLKKCWDKAPKNRPYFDAIKEEVKTIIKEYNEQNLIKSQENINEQI